MQLVSEIMSYDVAVVSPSDSVQQAIEKMTQWNISAVPVCENRNMIGILSKTDIAQKTPALDRSLENISTSELMTDRVVHCFEDQPVDEALHIMTEYRIKHLPVLNRNDELVGIVSLTDLANRVPGYTEEQAERANDAFGEHALSSSPMRIHRPLSDSVDGGP